MSIQVVRPGLLTSLQDIGRSGHQKYGVVVSGAMDLLALRVANLLVDNAEGAAACEITCWGPALRFEQDALIAICGGDLAPRIAQETVPAWRPVVVRRGSLLEFGEPQRGCRAYLAVAGGFDVPPVMGSRSTYLRAGLGGFHGRALKAGDVLDLQPPSELASRRMQRSLNAAGSRPLFASPWGAAWGLAAAAGSPPTVRAMRGGQFAWFTADSQERFFAAEFQVTSQSDRMGYRLAGPPLRLAAPRELISEAVSAGTIQVPAEGQPIVLMADCQTTGGYPKIAQAATVDLSVLAQARPGDRIRFQEISVAEAQDLYRAREAALEKLKRALKLREEM